MKAQTTKISTAKPVPGHPASQRPPTHEQVEKRAHEIFMARGCKPGRELEDWLQAENELKIYK